jgi:2-polyprenyl-3-methyl-5-hydroxy-6-metoxy-1,4-benzoquinol methylase
MGGREPLNKTMERADLDRPAARAVVEELDELVRWLARRGLRASSWYGSLDETASWERTNRGYGYEPLPGAADDGCFPWFLYWEIAWLATNLTLVPGRRLLDLGGSSSLFSFFAASRGLEVTTVDLNRALVVNADNVAARTGWRLDNHVMDMRDLRLEGTFDDISSVCVFEHIPLSGRVEVTSEIARYLSPGGTFSLTFDYLNPSRRARISSPADVHEQFVAPSGLRVRGNQRFHDNGHRYLLHPFFHPRAWRAGWKLDRLKRAQFGLLDLPRVKYKNDYTFGALFLERPRGGYAPPVR